ncbi:MAG: hypothetical protein GF346_04875 [Candidatus Eisenbacteria bacterium]|nr:hypothetical protein [Candidatus Latescibacterota bacterium]MBD3301760.1 hypothetical protein [Candidatus Eisenbacteria bacterium]
MPSLRKIFFEDLGTKALALVLALAIYVHVFSGQERELTFRIPLVISPPPTGLAYASEVPEQVRVRVRATGADLVKLSTRRFSAEVKLEDPEEGAWQRPLHGSDVKFPHGVRPVSVEVLEPRVLNLQIEPLRTVQIPVKLRTDGGLAPDRALARSPEIEPPRIEVRGPRSRIEAVDSIPTVPVQLGPEIPDGEQRVALDLPEGVTTQRDSVRVRLDVERRIVRDYGPIAIERLPPQGDRLEAMWPDSGMVVVSGAATIVERLNPSRIRLLADLRGRPNGEARIVLRPIVPGLPAGAPVQVRAMPDSVSVRLR